MHGQRNVPALTLRTVVWSENKKKKNWSLYIGGMEAICIQNDGKKKFSLKKKFLEGSQRPSKYEKKKLLIFSYT